MCHCLFLCTLERTTLHQSTDVSIISVALLKVKSSPVLLDYECMRFLYWKRGRMLIYENDIRMYVIREKWAYWGILNQLFSDVCDNVYGLHCTGCDKYGLCRYSLATNSVCHYLTSRTTRVVWSGPAKFTPQKAIFSQMTSRVSTIPNAESTKLCVAVAIALSLSSTALSK